MSTKHRMALFNPASVILVGTIALSLWTVGGTVDQPLNQIPIKYVKGAYEVPSPPTALPVLYDSFVPLIYEFHLPQWDINTMKIQFYKYHNNCTIADSYEEGYPCPVMYHWNRIAEEFRGNMTFWKNLFLPNDTDANVPLITKTKSILQDTEFYCSRIGPHFNAYQTTPGQLQDYLKMIEKCGDDPITVSVNLTETSVKLEDLYHTTFATFASDYWGKLTEGPREAAMVTAWATLGSSLMLHQYMETQKWSSAISSCQNNHIPWTLITHEDLQKALGNSSHVDNLSISLDQIQKYFRLPLTDCVFVGHDKLVVRILVPLNIVDNGYRMLRFEPVIFHENGHFCWIDGIREKKFVLDFKDNLYLTECSDSQLCKTSDHFHSSQDKADPCALAIYNDEEEDIVEDCPLRCLSGEKRHEGFKFFNIAYRSEDNFVYAAGDEDVEMKVECDGKSMQILPKLDYGAWNITIPCGCKLTGFDEQMDYPVQPPCINQYILEKIRPYHWRQISSPQNSSKEVRIPNTSNGSSSSGDNAPSSMTSEGYDLFMQRMDERFGSLYTHRTLLWIVNVMFMIIIGILSYMVYNLHKWRQEELYRENRLIYSRGDNGDDLSMERQPPRY